jgi:hypothetical protein
MRHNIVAITLLCIALLSVPASAGCAWVLWEQHRVMPLKDAREWWDVHGAYATQEECASVQLRIWKLNVASAQETLKYGNIHDIKTVESVLVSYSLKSGGHSSQSLMCLPDTVDPRGKQ